MNLRQWSIFLELPPELQKRLLPCSFGLGLDPAIPGKVLWPIGCSRIRSTLQQSPGCQRPRFIV